MPRRKKVSVTTIEDVIAARQKEKETMLAEEAGIEAQIAELKQLLKDKRKAIRLADKDIAALTAKKEKEDAIKAAVEQKSAITKVVEQLLQDGKTVEEILAAFEE